jgi:hypothetical protein
MHMRTIQTKAVPTATPAVLPGVEAALPGVEVSLVPQVQNALNLYLPLKNPTQMPGLLAMLQDGQSPIYDALKSLHYVHFARFLPMLDGSALWVITEFDGGLESYVMDFVAVLGDAFNMILDFVQGAPPLPVQKHAREFVAFVRQHNLPVRVWSAYPTATVIDIQRTARSL